MHWYAVRVTYSRELFFKQKTAYEISECDWSSDVCSSDLKENLSIANPNTNTHNQWIINPPGRESLWSMVCSITIFDNQLY